MAEGLDVQVAMLKTLECPVCLTMYNPRERQAQVLRCGHTFCKMCVDSMLISSAIVKCPKCRMFTESSDVRANFTVNEMFDALCGDCLREANSKQCCHCDKLLCKHCLVKHTETLREETQQQIRQCKKHVVALKVKIDDTTCIEDEMKNAQTTLDAMREHVKYEKSKLDKFKASMEEQILSLNVCNIDCHNDWKKRLESMHKDAASLAERSSVVSQDMDQQSILAVKQQYISCNNDILSAMKTSPAVERYAFIPKGIPGITNKPHGLLSTSNLGKLPVIQQPPGNAVMSRITTSLNNMGAIPKTGPSSYGKPVPIQIPPYQQFYQPAPMQTPHGYNGRLLDQQMFKFPAEQTPENIINPIPVNPTDENAVNSESDNDTYLVHQLANVNCTNPDRKFLGADRQGVFSSNGESNEESSAAVKNTDVNEQDSVLTVTAPKEKLTDIALDMGTRAVGSETDLDLGNIVDEAVDQSFIAELSTGTLGSDTDLSSNDASSAQATVGETYGILNATGQTQPSTYSNSVSSSSVKFPLCLSMHFRCPWDVDVSSNGDIYVSDDADKIIIFDSQYKWKSDFKVASPKGISINNDRILVCGAYSVHVFSLEMKLLKTFGDDICWQQAPRSVVQVNDDHIFICDKKYIRVFSTNGKYKTSHNHTTSLKGCLPKFPEPFYISTAKKCSLFVSFKNSLAIFNKDAGFKDFPLSTPANLEPIRPRGIATDSQGKIVIADFNGRVVIFSPAGKYLGSIGSRGSGIGQLEKPNGIAVDNNGRIIVCDTGNNRIQIFEMPSNLQK